MSGVIRGQGKEAVRLCEHIVRQAFGNVVCRVASVLLNRGRLPLPILSRLSGLTSRSAAASLLLLMQHNLVQTTSFALLPDPSTSTAEDQYEFDIPECLNRLRYGRILALTAGWPGFGKGAGVAEEIVRMVMIYGKVKVRDVGPHLGAKGDAKRTTAVQEALTTLVRWRFLIPTTPEMQILEAELIQKRFGFLKSEAQRNTTNKVLTATQLNEARISARNQILNERDDLQMLEKVLIRRERISKKKKKGEDEYDYELRPDVHLRINHDRYGILIRDELIVKAAEDRWNDGAGIVMRAVCSAALNEDSSLSDAKSNTDINFNEIVSRIPNSVYPTLGQGIVGGLTKSTTEIVKAYLAILAGEDQMIANGSSFLIKLGTNNPFYRVETEKICIRLREALLADLVRQRVGDKAGRVLAVVIKAKIASEQTVRDCAMLPLKDARILLARLQRLSLVETTEVPKTASKMRIGMPAGPEYHLWSVDLPRVYESLLSNIYKTIANIIQRRAAEVEKRNVVLEREAKAARQRGAGARACLQTKDQNDLGSLEESVKKMVLGQERSDLVAFILRDLPGWPAK